MLSVLCKKDQKKPLFPTNHKYCNILTLTTKQYSKIIIDFLWAKNLVKVIVALELRCHDNYIAGITT